MLPQILKGGDVKVKHEIEKQSIIEVGIMLVTVIVIGFTLARLYKKWP